jgi:hypothetical protein
MTLVEIAIVGIIIAALGAGGFVAMTSVISTAASTSAVPVAMVDATDVANTIAAGLRSAAQCTSGGIVGAAVQAASTNSVTVCTNGTGYTTYSVDGSGNFIQTTGTLPIGGATTVTKLDPPTVSLSISYCLSTGSSYNITGSLDDSTNSAISWVSGTLTTAQLKQVIAAKVTATVTRTFYAGSTSKSYTAEVRLRNSPAFTLS